MLKNSIFQVFGNVVSAGLNLLIIIFTARTLGASGRGEITYLLICLGLLQIFTSIVGNSVMIFMLTKHQRQDVLLGSFIWTGLVVILSFPLVYFLSDLNLEKILYFLILGVLQTSFNNLITFYSAQFKFKTLVLVRLFQPIVFFALILINYYTNKLTVNLYWTLLIISYLPHFILLLIETFKRFFLVSCMSLRSTILDFLKLGGLGQFTNLMQFSSYRFAVLIIAKTLGMKDVGIFGLWLSVTDAIWLIPGGLATVNMSYAAKDNYKLKNIYKYILTSIAISSMLIVVVLIIPNNLYILLLGKDFTQLKSLIIYSSPIVILFTINIIVAYYFSAKGLIKYNTLSSGLGCLSILIITVFLTNKFELMGAVLANCLSYAITLIVTIFLFFRHKKQFNSNSIPIN